MTFQIRNVKFASEDQTKIELEAIVPWIPAEWIPLYLTADYDQEYGRDLFAQAIAGTFGEIAPYAAPPFVRVVPQVVSRFQALAAMHQAGLLDSIETYMQQSTTDWFVKLAWEEAQEYRRDSPTVQVIGDLFGLTPTQLDDLFIFAGTVTA